MANGGLVAVSIVLGFLVIIGMHWYYPQNALSQVVSSATMDMSHMNENFAMGPIMSFSVGILIEYSIVVFAIYLFFRSIIKSFRQQ